MRDEAGNSSHEDTRNSGKQVGAGGGSGSNLVRLKILPILKDFNENQATVEICLDKLDREKVGKRPMKKNTG